MIVRREIPIEVKHSHRGMLVEPPHGHQMIVAVSLKGVPNEEGFVCDFRAVKRVFRYMVGRTLQGKNLDSFFEYPTSENLARWIWERLDPFFPLYSVEVREKSHSMAIYYGPQRRIPRGE